jgi:ribose transport system substrate-binding protein
VKHSIVIAAVSALVAVLLTIWGLWPDSGGQEMPPQMVALILDTDIGVNSAVIRQGAQMAAREYGAELTVSALSGTDVPEKQIGLIREQLDEGASAVLLVPAKESIVSDAARLCGQYNAKLVLLDACMTYRGMAPYVGTDHMASGIRAAETLLRLSNAKQLLVLCSVDQVSAERLMGVRLAAMRADVKAIVGQVPLIGDKPCNTRVRDLLSQNPDAKAVLCLDGALTECAAQEIKLLGLKGQVMLAGFDCDQTHINCLEDGSVRFTVLREPLAVGYEGFKCAMEMITWDVVIAIKYVNVTVVMSEDILKPENVRLVFPLIQ